MSNIQDTYCIPRLHALIVLLVGVWEPCCGTSSFLSLWVHMPAIHAASHADHEKKVAWFSIATCMHACGSVLIIVMVLRLADLRAP